MSSMEAFNVKEIPDLHHKMSKKIAQLTKVIYHLNTKNDDHEAELQSLNAAHENEIDQILKDALRRLNVFNEELIAKTKEVEASQNIEVLHRSHEEEKKKYIDQFEQYKKEVITNQDEIHRNYETQVQFITKDLEDMKTQFSNKVKSFQETLKTTNQTHEDELITLKSAHSKELEDLTKRLQSERDTKLRELTIELEKGWGNKLIEQKMHLDAQHTKALNDELQKVLNEKNEQLHAHTSASLQSKQDMFDTQLKNMESRHFSDIEKLNTERTFLSSKILELEQALTASKGSVLKLEEQIVELRSEKDTMQVQHKTETEKLLATIQQTQNLLATTQTEHKQQQHKQNINNN